MEIYLIRHTTPAIKAGICYGQSNLDIIETFEKEAEVIARSLPHNIRHVISSPLQRCRKLAELLFPDYLIELNDNLKEIHCGDWELKKWDDIPREILDPWMKKFVTTHFPNGESYEEFYERVINQFEKVIHNYREPIAIVSHGGVIRSILSYISYTPLKDSFNRFKIPYGTVVQLIHEKGNWQQKILP
jgi:alpha-ribazole phosphatase